jgi:hypothetical protein
MRFSTFGPHISSFDSKYVLEAMKQKVETTQKQVTKPAQTTHAKNHH